MACWTIAECCSENPLKCLTARQERGVRIDRNLLSEKLKAFGNEEQGSIATYITEQLYYNYDQLIFNTHFFHARILQQNPKGKKNLPDGHPPRNQDAEAEFSQARESILS